jgi:hypothetical protein
MYSVIAGTIERFQVSSTNAVVLFVSMGARV